MIHVQICKDNFSSKIIFQKGKYYHFTVKYMCHEVCKSYISTRSSYCVILLILCGYCCSIQHLVWLLLVERGINSLDNIKSVLKFHPPGNIIGMLKETVVVENQQLLGNCSCFICFVLQVVFQYCGILGPLCLTLQTWYILPWKPQRMQDLNLVVEKHWAICADCQRTAVLKHKPQTGLPREILPGVNHFLKKAARHREWGKNKMTLKRRYWFLCEVLGKLDKTICSLRKTQSKI